MKFSAVVEQVLELLQRQRRISYRALKQEFELDDDYIEDIKAEIIDARRFLDDARGCSRTVVLASRRSAEEDSLKAIEVAQRQKAKSLELRATISFARLWQGQDKHHEARCKLVEVYNWFTEGFDTADLKEAKALLEELA